MNKTDTDIEVFKVNSVTNDSYFNNSDIKFSSSTPKVLKDKLKKDQGDQCQSPGFYFNLDLIFMETFKFCNISVIVTFQFW